jgi:Fe-S cluster biogenesis protein NfuA
LTVVNTPLRRPISWQSHAVYNGAGPRVAARQSGKLTKGLHRNGEIWYNARSGASQVTATFIIKEESGMREQIEQALDKIRPLLQRDGGDVELVEVGDDGVVKVRLTGACGGCPLSTITLKQGIERTLKQEVPAVKEVVSV